MHAEDSAGLHSRNDEEVMTHHGAVTLLHVSDLHFGRHHRFTSANGPSSLLERLRVDLDGLREKEALRPDLVIVSGDLAELGKKAEFEQAMQFLQRLAQTVELPPNRIVIVPGNHDINWSYSKSYFEECAGNDEIPLRPYFKKLEFFRAAFDKFYAGTEGITFTEEEPWSFFEYPELGVVVAGMNSVIAESHDPQHHFGFLGEEQLRKFAEKLRPYKERGFLRIGVMHHNPRDRRGGEETKQDQEHLKRLLAPSLNMLLHGDIHEETEDALRVNVPVFGIGSLSVNIDQRPEEMPNEYQLLQIRGDGVRRVLRIYAPDQGRFLPSARADAAGAAMVVDVPVAFDHVEALGQTKAPKRETDLEELVEQYRRSIVVDQRMQTVGDLLGRDALGTPMTALDTLRLFVPQDVLGEEPMGHLVPSAPDKRIPNDEPVGGYSDTAAGILTRGWVYLLGAPGAGKTALTRWILLSLCVPGERIEGFAEDLVPVRVDMRLFHVAHEKAVGTFSFFECLDQEHAKRFWNLRGEPLRELARRGRLYFLFDGLDEVIDESRRREYAEMIAGLARADEYARCRGVVTSRVVGAEVAQSLFDGSGFSTYTLRDFTEKQQDRFLDAWHGLVFAREPEMLTHRRTRLARALEASTSLRALCGNPLCCSLLAYLNRDEELPEGRHHLYQKILERLTEHWDANKGLLIRNASLRFELSDKLSFLRHLAWRMMDAGGAEAGNAIAGDKLVEFAQSFCEERWTETPDAARRRAERLIGSLRERNEVLAWLGGDIYGFSHRAFLEYSAAARAVEKHGQRAEISSLAQWFHEHWRAEGWEETLLLTCGLLREVDQGPALVVQLLQEMPGGDRAVVYRNLDDYLCFCIKALGELRSLERGVVREFVEEINGILEYRIVRDPPLHEQQFLEAFRRCSGKWPDIDRLIRATNESIDKPEKKHQQNISHLWIAAAGRNGRLKALLEALDMRGRKLDSLRKESSLLCREAASFGPWSTDEETALCRAAEREDDDGNRYHLLKSIARAPGTPFHADEPVIHALAEIMHSSSPELQWKRRAAYALIKRGIHVEEALSYLRACLNDADSNRAAWAAHALFLRGYGDEAIAVLSKLASSHLWCLADLISLAKTNQIAQQALVEVSQRIRQAPDARVTFSAFAVGMSKNYPLIDQDDMSQRLRSVDPGLAISLLEQNSDISRLGPFIAKEYRWWLSKTSGQPAWHRIARNALRVGARKGGESFQHIWADLLDCDVADFVTSAASLILQFSKDESMRKTAQAKMLRGIRSDASEEIRLGRARALGPQDSQASNVFNDLSQNAILESVRLDAACFIGNFPTIAHLADRADDDSIKQQAREAQDLYAHIHRLLHVGRPRRAIVKLHNERAGILEETTSNGGTKFTYDKAYREKPGARPLAPNLPLRAEPYEHPTTLHPFFANLLPEGPIFEQTARRLGLPKTDRFGILLKVGEDVMGAVQVFPEESN